MPNQVSNSVRLILKPFLFDYKIILNTDAPATNAEATYTVKQTKKIIAQITCSVLDFVAKRFERYCGTVIASPAALENFLSLVAQKIQFAAVPSTRHQHRTWNIVGI